ncbi:invertase/recombinase-like protein [Candidatus Magnetoovum chiemensis]|nr:invertase/recombinase-like protein [Candidatus Magnetoovum chiemensis]
MRQTEQSSIRLVGYARVSTADQDLNLQIDELKKAGCEPIFTDQISGAKTERKGLEECLGSLKPADTLIVWRLDRLGRSMSHLVQIITRLKEQNIGFKSLRDGAIDTTTASGELVFNIFAALAQFERELIRERTRAGLSSARARGRLGGRKAILSGNSKVKMAKAMHQNKSMSINEICETLKISRATFYRYLSLG